MKQIPLPAFSDRMIVYDYPDVLTLGKCELHVPAGYEAVVVTDGRLSDLYREGDIVRMGDKGGERMIKSGVTMDSHLYIIRKSINQPIMWGVGDIPNCTGHGNPPALYGANGCLQISIHNSLKLVRRILGSAHKIDTHLIGKYLDSQIAGIVKSRLMESVKGKGLPRAYAKREHAASAIRIALCRDFDAFGIWVDSFAIDMINVMPLNVS